MKRNAKDKLLDAALNVIRQRGFAATTVDELCATAGVTKGAFFHHFASKEALGVAAAEHWSTVTGALFREAPYHEPKRPLDRVLAYIDFRRALLAGETAEFTCLVGTMVQETYDVHPAIRDACCESIFGHAGTLVSDIAAAMEEHGGPFPCTPESLANHTQTVLQGGFILAKAADDVGPAIDAVEHLRSYVRLLFALPPTPNN